MLAGGDAGGGVLDSAALVGAFFPDLGGGGAFFALSGATAAGPVGGVGCWASASC